jgi:hypothetical protein
MKYPIPTEISASQPPLGGYKNSFQPGNMLQGGNLQPSNSKPASFGRKLLDLAKIKIRGPIYVGRNHTPFQAGRNQISAFPRSDLRSLSEERKESPHGKEYSEQESFNNGNVDEFDIITKKDSQHQLYAEFSMLKSNIFEIENSYRNIRT